MLTAMYVCMYVVVLGAAVLGVARVVMIDRGGGEERREAASIFLLCGRELQVRRYLLFCSLLR